MTSEPCSPIEGQCVVHATALKELAHDLATPLLVLRMVAGDASLDDEMRELAEEVIAKLERVSSQLNRLVRREGDDIATQQRRLR